MDNILFSHLSTKGWLTSVAYRKVVHKEFVLLKFGHNNEAFITEFALRKYL